MNTIKDNLNKIKLIKMAFIMKTCFIGAIGYCSTHPWTTHPYLTGSFAPIPIVVTLLNGPKTINHTGIEMYTDMACSNTTENIINIGSPPTFDFTTSTTYFLGLSAYTSDFFNSNTQSIQVNVDADRGASGSVCIQISCSSNASCTAMSRPYLLNI